jgi:hypothetical protein
VSSSTALAIAEAAGSRLVTLRFEAGGCLGHDG